MKMLQNVTLVNSLNEIYELFTKVYPEMKRQVIGWRKWGKFTDTFRGIIVEFQDGKRLLFSVRRIPETEGWSVSDLYLIPGYVEEIPEEICGSFLARGIGPAESLEDLAEIFYGMFPEHRDQVVDLQMWRRFTSRYRGVMIWLADRKKILFAVQKNGDHWNAAYPILVTAPDEDMAPLGEMEKIMMSDLVIFAV